MIGGNTAFFEHSLKLWEGLSHDLNFNCMVSQRGQIVLAVSPVQMDVFARRGNIMRLNGIDAELLDRGEVRKLLPYLDYSKDARWPIYGAIMQPRAGTVRHDAVAWGYARAASSARRPHHRELRGHGLRHRRTARCRASKPRAAASMPARWASRSRATPRMWRRWRA